MEGTVRMIAILAMVCMVACQPKNKLVEDVLMDDSKIIHLSTVHDTVTNMKNTQAIFHKNSLLIGVLIYEDVNLNRSMEMYYCNSNFEIIKPYDKEFEQAEIERIIHKLLLQHEN